MFDFSIFRKFFLSIIAYLLGGIGLLTSIIKDATFPNDYTSISALQTWILQPKNMSAVISSLLVGLGTYWTIKQMRSPTVATQETSKRIETDLKEVKSEIIKELDLVSKYYDLPLEYINRLPTALLVADYGIIPYDDALGTKANLLSWITKNNSPSGLLLTAKAGYGKTRLAFEIINELNQDNWNAGFITREAFNKKKYHR